MDIMQTIHRLGIALGAVVLIGGLALLFAPSVAQSVPVDFLVADVAAVLAVLLGIWVVRQRYQSSQNSTYVPEIEVPLATPTPGDDIDELIYRLTELREGTIEYRERIRERISEIAIAVVSERWDCSREQAIERLEAGTWTENEGAIGYFGAGGPGSTSLIDDLRERFLGEESAYEKQLRETVGAIEEVSDYEFSKENRVSDEEEATVSLDPRGLAAETEGERVTETVRYRTSFPTRHWSGISAFALLALAVGIITAQPSLLLASAAGVGLAGYSRATSAPSLASLEVTRSVSDENPQPNDEIEVSVTVENTGNTILSDLTLVDRPPAMSKVVDGSARLGTALRPGGTATFSYSLEIPRGKHSWPVQVIGRDPAGALEREAYIEPESETTVECVPRLKTVTEMPVRLQTSVYAGEVNTEIGGEGLEFFSLRDYQPGDPKRRIDWKSYAKTGEFTTIDFREEHAARVVLLFDGRESSYVSPGPGKRHAVERSVDVASDIFASLTDQGHLVGVAAFNGIPLWLGPDTGTLHRQRVRNLFVEHPVISSLPPDLREEEEGRYVDPMVHIRRQLPENTQVFLFSPLTDEYTYETARRLNGAGHLVTVISPDPTAGRTVGQRLARLERTVLVKRLRDHGIRVIDWSDEQPLNVELEYASRRWNA